MVPFGVLDMDSPFAPAQIIGCPMRGTDIVEANLALQPLLRRQNRSSSDGPVAIFWDIENCIVPKDVRPEDIAYNIKMALDAHPMFNGAAMSLAVYGDFIPLLSHLREGCQRTGVKFIDVPNGKEDATDKAILVDMFLFAQDNPPPSSIMLISGDVDFAPALHVLGQRGHMIILVIPSGVGISLALRNAGRFMWDWLSVARGEVFDLSTEVIIGTHGGHCETVGYLRGCQRGRDTAEANSALQPPLSHQNRSSSNGLVAIFWDIKNCPIPEDVHHEDVACNIRMALAHLMINGAIMSFAAYGDFNTFPRHLREGCQRTGIKLIDVVNGKGDVANKVILVDMFLFAQDNPPPSSIMLISGDVDFVPALQVLGQRGHTIILAIPFDASVSHVFCNVGRFVWDWPSVARGEVFDLPAEVITSTHGGHCETVGYFRGCLINENQDYTNEQEAIVYSSIAMPCYALTSRSHCLPTGLNEVTAGGLISLADQSNSTPWGQHANFNQLKRQLVGLVEHSGGCLPLTRVPGKYQRFYGAGVQKANNVVTIMLNKGFMLGKDTINSATIVMLCFALTSRSHSVPNGLNEVIARGLISSAYQNDYTPWRQHADLNQLKRQIVALVEHSGGHLPLNLVLGKFRRFCGRPLPLSEYVVRWLGDLFKKMNDAMAVERIGPKQLVCLHIRKPGPSTPALVWTKKDKKGKKPYEGTEAIVLVGSSDGLLIEV